MAVVETGTKVIEVPVIGMGLVVRRPSIVATEELGSCKSNGRAAQELGAVACQQCKRRADGSECRISSKIFK